MLWIHALRMYRAKQRRIFRVHIGSSDGFDSLKNRKMKASQHYHLFIWKTEFRIWWWGNICFLKQCLLVLQCFISVVAELTGGHAVHSVHHRPPRMLNAHLYQRKKHSVCEINSDSNIVYKQGGIHAFSASELRFIRHFLSLKTMQAC